MSKLDERVIKIEKIDPKDLFGPNNKYIKHIKLKFPELKIVARGDKIKAYGSKKDLNDFEERIKQIINYFIEYNILSDNEIEMLLSNDNVDISTSKNSYKPIIHGVNGRVIKAKSVNQRKIVDAITDNNMVFAIGPAGTGKTYTGIALAVKALKQKEVKRIILTRPALEAGENLGFLPGDLKEKLDPYMQPLYDALKDMIPSEKLKKFIDEEIIQIACEYFALEGLGKLLNTIKSIQKIHNQNLSIEGLLLTMYDSRLKLSNQVIKEVKLHFTEMVFKTIIHRNVKLGEAPSYGESILEYDINSTGANNYLNLARELILNN